jgi:hypothetical protein
MGDLLLNEYNIKMDFKEPYCEHVNLIELDQDRIQRMDLMKILIKLRI